ncbi:uncharacterized protein LOC108664663 [Hyalella azteca]|uniref:Uncharacterized protein LOC108664663 n=1 Tax=Hyalella azteca TaxID=294128 RepID=A0A8B7MZV2_HYAAZ|nr:uncharacterized protein LOC108664663 [Hyalella azteca]
MASVEEDQEPLDVACEATVGVQGDDEINADEEINEVVEDDSGELDRSGATDGTAGDQEEAADSESPDTSKNQEETPEARGEKNDVGDGEATGNDEEQNQESAKKLLRMQLSTQTLQKLLKEGKMEKLPTGSFRISSEALKELRKDTQKAQETTPVESEESPRKRKISEVMSEEASPSKAKYHKNSIMRKRGGAAGRGGGRLHPKSMPPALTGKKLTPKQLQNLQTAQQKMLHQKLARRPKKRRVHDYLSDFNSSEDDDGDQIIADLKDSLAELAPRKGDDLSKNMNLLFEQLHKSIFGGLSDESDEDENENDLGEEERMRQLAYSDPDFETPDSSTGELSIPENFFMTGRVGNDSKTVMCIRSSGKRRTWNGMQCPVYTIDTSVEQSTTVTPLLVTAFSTSPGYAKQKEVEDKTLLMSDPDLVEQLLAKNVSLRKYKEQVKVLRRRYLQLARRLATRPQLQTIADLVAASSRFLTQDQMVFFTMQLKAGCDSTQGARFSAREKLLAMGLYQQDPETYKWLQRLFHLPSTSELERWLDAVARGNPMRVKQLMYYVYTRYCFRPRDDVFPHTLSGY